MRKEVRKDVTNGKVEKNICISIKTKFLNITKQFNDNNKTREIIMKDIPMR